MILTNFIQILSIFVPLSTSIRLQCNFQDSSWSYKCSTKSLSITSKADRTINLISGHHIDGRTSRKVLAFSAHNFDIFYFPHNITQHLINLRYISIQNSGLKEINSDDLEQFGDNLIYLWLCGNEIEIIERNLLEHNKNVGFLNLNGNKIKFFEGGVTEMLAYPHSLYFNNNPCFSGIAKYSEKNVEKLVKEITEKCTFGFYLKCRMNDLIEKVESLERENVKLKKKIEKLELGN